MAGGIVGSLLGLAVFFKLGIAVGFKVGLAVSFKLGFIVDLTVDPASVLKLSIDKLPNVILQ